MIVSVSEAQEKATTTTTREWSELPDLVLATIVGLLLPTHRDLFSFSSVCRSWRCLLRSLSPSLLPSLPPLLLTRSFHLLAPSDPLLSFPQPNLLLPSSHRFLSFSHGYILFLPSSPPLQPVLADVITGHRILLPPLPSDHRRFTHYYATLTAHPSSPSSRFLLFFSKFVMSSHAYSWSELVNYELHS